ncbi:MAG: hypothetical protein K2J37_04920, partial [Ruminococcus sp.]|nr:hypothetical protein [Ruminococcus sp.]
KSGLSETTKAKTESKTKSDSKTTTSEKSGNTSTEKNSGENNHEPESETPEPVEFREYYPEDFNEVDIQFVKQDGEPPVNISEYNLDIKTDGSKMSPCKAVYDFVPETEIPEYLNDYPEQLEDYKIEMEKRNEHMRQILENPCAGFISSYSLCGDNLYFMVSYDDLDTYTSHCFELYQYNIKSNKQQLLYSYEDAEISIALDYYKEIDGELYISTNTYKTDGDAYSYSIARLDRKNKKLVDISTPELRERQDTIYILENSADRLLVLGYKEKNEEENFHIVSEYNPDTGEWAEVFRSDEYYPVVQGNDIGYSEKIDRYVSCTVEGKYTIHTGLIGTELKGFNDTQMICFTSDSINRLLYIFDTEKMERYKIDMKGMGDYFTFYPMNDLFYIQGQLVFGHAILLPEVGMAFQLHTNYRTHYDGSRLWSLTVAVEDSFVSLDSFTEVFYIDDNDFTLEIIE